MNCDWLESDTKNGRRVFRCRRSECQNALYAESAVECFAECRSNDALPCPHLKKTTGQKVEIVCICCGGKRATRESEIFECGLFGECLPKYECTRDSKVATAEWMERNGREVAIPVCRGCERKLPET